MVTHRERYATTFKGCFASQVVDCRRILKWTYVLLYYTFEELIGCFASQVVDCRRILKWTYALGYYTFEEDLRASKAAKEAKAQQQEFFEFNQGQVGGAGCCGGLICSWAS